MREPIVQWVGALIADELLWPQELIEADVIDLSGITAVGTWIHVWFRARPNQSVVGARPEVRRQLEAAGVPIVFRDHASVGVTSQERGLLLD
jgi:hypothetical protein